MNFECPTPKYHFDIHYLPAGRQVQNSVFIIQTYPAQPSLSKLLKWIASAKCSSWISSLPARSAMVRATFKMRSYARADRPSFSMAFLRRFWPAGVILQMSRTIWGLIWALACRSGRLPKRSAWISRALITRSRISSLFSARRSLASSLKFTGVTSTCRSMRSSKGPEILLKYFCTTPGGHTHSFSGWLK